MGGGGHQKSFATPGTTSIGPSDIPFHLDGTLWPPCSQTTKYLAYPLEILFACRLGGPFEV